MVVQRGRVARIQVARFQMSRTVLPLTPNRAPICTPGGGGEGGSIRGREAGGVLWRAGCLRLVVVSDAGRKGGTKGFKLASALLRVCTALLLDLSYRCPLHLLGSRRGRGCAPLSA